jgi:ABC-type dipeptide/oligopeptide/nickel transport system permease component
MQGTLPYLMRRLALVPLILFCVSFATFAIARLGPGDPVRVAAGQFRDPEAFARIRHARGLDKPIYEQYVIYMRDVLTHGDLGESFRYRDRTVSQVIFPAIWHSMQYNSIALVIMLVIGIPLGIFAARNQGNWRDPVSISSFLFFQSIPSLVSVPFLLLFLSLKLGVVPARGWPQECDVSLGFLGDSYKCIGVLHSYHNIKLSLPSPISLNLSLPVLGLSKEAFIPLIALSVPAIATWARFTRAFTLDVLREDYIRTARSKGISEFRVMTQHVLRNALLPLSTIIAFALIGLLEGSFFVETLTGIPGVGRLAFESVGGRDYDMIMAVTMIGAVSFVIASIAIDIGYTLIDPRIRYVSGR